MRRAILIVTAAAVFPWNLMGAPSGTPEPLPPGPLLKRAPDSLEWEIRVDTAESSVPAQPPQEGKAPPPPPPKIAVVTKGGKVVREIITYANGTAVEIWHRGGVAVSRKPGDKIWTVSPASPPGFESPDYINSDFSDLEWISPSTFTGIQSIGGRKVIVFTGTVCDKGSTDLSIIKNGVNRQRGEEAMLGHLATKAFDPNDYKVPAVAYIDMETRLPIKFQYGNMIRSYTYRVPTQAVSNFPGDAEQAVASTEKYKASLSRGPAAP